MAWMGIESLQYEADFAWLQLQFIYITKKKKKEEENSCSRRVKERDLGGVSGGRWLGGHGCFVWRFSVGSASLKKFQISWLAKRCLILLFRQPTSLYGSTVCVHTNVQVVSVCFRNPLSSDTDNVGSLTCLHDLLMHVYSHVFCLLHLFLKTELLLFSWGVGGWGVRWGGSFSSGRALGPPFTKS